MMMAMMLGITPSAPFDYVDKYVLYSRCVVYQMSVISAKEAIV